MNFKIKPWAHQLNVIESSKTMQNVALFFEMGTGKTATTINMLRYQYAIRRKLMRTLILAPPIVLHNWRREFFMHSKISNRDIIILEKSGKRRVKTFISSASDIKNGSLTRPRIFITNYEAMQMEELFKYIMEWKPEILVCDESHRLKNHQSKRAKNVIKIADGADHKYILTGTPILNSAMDIFNQFRVLDGGETFGQNFYQFRAIWFEDENAAWSSRPAHFPKYVPRASTYKDFHDKIYKQAFRVLKKDCLDLPPLVKERIDISLGVEQKRMYEEMKNEFITYVEKLKQTDTPRAVVAQMAITKALRLQQIVSGYAKTEDGEEIEIKDNPRLEALSDLLNELVSEHKVIVWATFQANYRQIKKLCEKLEIECAELHGKVTGKRRLAEIERFRHDDRCRVLIANQGAGGVGINLVEASYSVFFSRSFSLEHDLQAEARNHRGGSEIHEKVTRIDFVASGTIDEVVMETLARKQNISDQILDLKERL